MSIKRNGSQPSSKGPDEWFTGSVRVDPLFEAPIPARARGASVIFEPGARTAWAHVLAEVRVPRKDETLYHMPSPLIRSASYGGQTVISVPIT
jgi:hypothetical protein